MCVCMYVPGQLAAHVFARLHSRSRCINLHFIFMRFGPPLIARCCQPRASTTAACLACVHVCVDRQDKAKRKQLATWGAFAFAGGCVVRVLVGQAGGIGPMCSTYCSVQCVSLSPTPTARPLRRECLRPPPSTHNQSSCAVFQQPPRLCFPLTPSCSGPWFSRCSDTCSA